MAGKKDNAVVAVIADLTQTQAAMLLSLVGDIRISQVVNPKKGCRMSLAKEYIAGLQG